MSVKISLSGSGLNFVGEVEFLQATQILAFIAQPSGANTVEVPLEIQSSISPPEVPKKPVATSGYESPRDAIEELKARTNPQKIVAISVYLGASSENLQMINVDQILEEFAKAGEPTPKNIGRDIRDAVTSGYIYPETKTTFRLLSSADRVKDEGFKKLKRKPTINKSGQKASPESKLLRAEVTSIPIVATMEPYLDYFGLKQKSDEILWIIKYASSQSIPSLSRSEIIDISSRLGGGVDSKGFTASNKPNVKNGYILVTNSLISITPNGEKHMSEKLLKPTN